MVKDYIWFCGLTGCDLHGYSLVSFIIIIFFFFMGQSKIAVCSVIKYFFGNFKCIFFVLFCFILFLFSSAVAD